MVMCLTNSQLPKTFVLFLALFLNWETCWQTQFCTHVFPSLLIQAVRCLNRQGSPRWLVWSNILVSLGRDWLLWWWGTGMESRSRMVRCMLKSCTQSYLVVFIVGPVRDEILFDYMHGWEFWVYDTCASVSWVHHVVLYREGSEIEKTDPCGMEGWRWMRRSRKIIRDMHPNTAKCTERCWDGTQDSLLRATNQPLSYREDSVGGLRCFEFRNLARDCKRSKSMPKGGGLPRRLAHANNP